MNAKKKLYDKKIYGHLTIYTVCSSVATKLECMFLYLYAVALQFSFSEITSLNMFQHDNAPVHTLSSMETWFAKIGVDQFKWPPQRET